MYFNYAIGNMLYSIRAYYNELAKENDWEHLHHKVHYDDEITTPCKIVDFFDGRKPHGKFPKSMAEDTIVMEHKYLLKLWSKHLDKAFQDN